MPALHHPSSPPPRVIDILLRGEYSVESVAELYGISQPATSGHLRLMEGRGLLRNKRRGRSVYYSVTGPQLVDIIDCVRDRYAANDAWMR